MEYLVYYYYHIWDRKAHTHRAAGQIFKLKSVVVGRLFFGDVIADVNNKDDLSGQTNFRNIR